MPKLITNIKVVDPKSEFNGKTVDLLWENGAIKKIAPSIKANAETIDGTGKYLSPSWVDTFADYCDPGYEYKETLDSGMQSAAAGGFGNVFICPNTLPAITNGTTVSALLQRAKNNPVKVSVLGAVSKNIEGKELAEMIDMRSNGAIAFTDGWHPLQNPMLLLKALEYIKEFNGVILQIPIHTALSQGGLMNESPESVRLGMASIPSVGESILIKRDIELVKYTQSRLHFVGVSTKEALEAIRKAKEEGLSITCSVSPFHLLFTDETLENYDSNFKVNPPLRTEEDRKALLQGVRDGVIDCIASMHHPQDIDSKSKEFEYAGWGMNVQETTWPMLLKALPDLSMDRWIKLLVIRPREIFNLPASSIQEGQPASFTVFGTEEKWRFNKDNKKSKGVNNPLLGQDLVGKATVLN